MAREIPFGLKAGMLLTDFPTQMEEAAPGILRLTVPKPHPEFPSYLGLIAPRSGLQWIKAIGKSIKTNSHGTALRASFDEFANRLTKVYGKGRIDDILLDGALFDQPHEFMKALDQGERVLCMTWDGRSRATVEPPLASVCLSALSLDDETGFLAIEYELADYGQARREIEAQQDDVL